MNSTADRPLYYREDAEKKGTFVLFSWKEHGSKLLRSRAPEVFSLSV